VARVLCTRRLFESLTPRVEAFYSFSSHPALSRLPLTGGDVPGAAPPARDGAAAVPARHGPQILEALGEAAAEHAARQEGPRRATAAALARGHVAALTEHVLRHFERMPVWLATAVRDTLLGSQPAPLSHAALAARPLLEACARAMSEVDTAAAPRVGGGLAAGVAAAMFELPRGARLSTPANPPSNVDRTLKPD
jgi:hypothetical protein